MPSSQPHSSAAVNLALVTGSLVMTALLIALVEGGLRVAGLGDPDASRTSRLKYQQVYLPILVPGRRPDGTSILHTNDRRLPYQAILRDKPVAGLRVFTFGGSATAGLGYSPNVTFARHLGRMLERAYPERAVEVVNLGIVALSSLQVKLIVEDVTRRYEPDLVVVYAGNNEFLDVHAEKYAAAHATWLSPLKDALIDTNTYRFVKRALRGEPRQPSLADQDFSSTDLRLTQNAIIQDVKMTRAEIDEVVARYAANIRELAETTKAANVPLLLMTVASNWKWQGRSDLAVGWIDELLGDSGDVTPERLARARTLLDEKLAAAGGSERSEWLFRRAKVAEQLGDFAAARRDYRTAMNEDPHLRRALDVMADRVRAVGREAGVRVLDTIEVLARSADHGIVGFAEFYDYVHFKPIGVVRTATAIFDAMVSMRVVPEPRDFDSDVYLARETNRLATPSNDPLDVSKWMGIGFEPDAVADRDLWKYDRMLQDLDARIEDDPSDFSALVYRGNAAYFRADGTADAARDYRAALALHGDVPEVHTNLEQLLVERAP